MHRAVQHRVVLVVERAADVGHVDTLGSDADPARQRRRNGGAREDRGPLGPHARRHRRTDVERRHLQPRSIAGPRHERDITVASFDRDVELLDRPAGHRLGAQSTLLGVLVAGVDRHQHLVGATEPEAGIVQDLLHRIGQRGRQPVADVWAQCVAKPFGDLGDRPDQLRVVEDAPNDARQCREATGSDLDADRVAHDVLEHVRLVEDDDVVLRQDRAAARHVESVQVCVDHDHVGCASAAACLFGEARVAQGAPVGAGALVAADAHRSPRVVGWRPVELGHVARGRGAGPFGESLDLDLGGQCHRLEFELALIARAHLAEPLEAHVVRSTLEHRPVEVSPAVLGEERQVLGGELVLQRLGRGGDDHARIGFDGRHQVGEGLARAGPRLDDEMSTRRDRRGDEVGHLLLADTIFGVRECGGDPSE
jgi:hypothetical protein